jgi:hypothetical protein
MFLSDKSRIFILGLIAGVLAEYVGPKVTAALMTSSSSAISSVQIKETLIATHFITDNKRFDIVDDAPTGGPVVLREAVRVDRQAGIEGADASVAVDAFDGAQMKPLWQFRERGEVGELRGSLYRIVKFGCCGAPPTYSYFSLQEGASRVLCKRLLFSLRRRRFWAVEKWES